MYMAANHHNHPQPHQVHYQNSQQHHQHCLHQQHSQESPHQYRQALHHHHQSLHQHGHSNSESPNRGPAPIRGHTPHYQQPIQPHIHPSRTVTRSADDIPTNRVHSRERRSQNRRSPSPITAASSATNNTGSNRKKSVDRNRSKSPQRKGPLAKHVPGAKGNKQSPIDIVTSQSVYDETLGDGQFRINYHSDDFVELVNTGMSWQINLKNESQSTLEAAHLNGTYRLKQIHCHWGTEPMNGSEHTVGGVGYAGEIHFVNWKVQYGSIEEAFKQPDGLAVLAVFLNETHDDNPVLEELVKLMVRMQYKGESVRLARYNAKALIPEKHEFWTYEGSLTTPPFSESVVWTVFRPAIPISSRQLEAFRSLFAVPVEDAERNPTRLVNNTRPVQTVNNRLVRSSFRSGGVIQS